MEQFQDSVATATSPRESTPTSTPASKPVIQEFEGLPAERNFITCIISSSRFETFMGFLIICILGLIVVETDARTVISGNSPGSAEVQKAQRTLDNIAAINGGLLVFFSFECACRLMVHRLQFFFSMWNVLDFVVVALGICGAILEKLLDNSNMGSMSLLRSIRMVRLLRLTRLLIAFPELYCLICGLTNCLKTLMWASGLIFVTLTVFSIISVEYMQPMMVQLVADGKYGSCGWCPTAFETVMYSNLTFFQIVSGDGWSLIARPLIEHQPFTAIVFLMVIFTIVFGLLNLVIAAIVDTASRARENDLETLSKHMNQERLEAWTTFQDLCKELDLDGSGDLTFEELKEGLETSSTLRNYFSVMGVEEDDLEVIFDLFDTDGNGELSYSEFHQQLYKMKTLETKTVLYYLQTFIQHMHKRMVRQETKIDAIEMTIRGLGGATVGATSYQEGDLPIVSNGSVERDRPLSTWTIGETLSDGLKSDMAVPAASLSKAVRKDVRTALPEPSGTLEPLDLNAIECQLAKWSAEADGDGHPQAVKALTVLQERVAIGEARRAPEKRNENCGTPNGSTCKDGDCVAGRVAQPGCRSHAPKGTSDSDHSRGSETTAGAPGAVAAAAGFGGSGLEVP